MGDKEGRGKVRVELGKFTEMVRNSGVEEHGVERGSEVG